MFVYICRYFRYVSPKPLRWVGGVHCLGLFPKKNRFFSGCLPLPSPVSTSHSILRLRTLVRGGEGNMIRCKRWLVVTKSLSYLAKPSYRCQVWADEGCYICTIGARCQVPGDNFEVIWILFTLPSSSPRSHWDRVNTSLLEIGLRWHVLTTCASSTLTLRKESQKKNTISIGHCLNYPS